MKVIPRLLFVLTVCSQVFPQTAAKPVHQNCAGPNVPFSVCAAIYADGTTLYVFQAGAGIMVIGANGTRLIVGNCLGTQTGMIEVHSYRDTSRSPPVTYNVLSFSDASIWKAGAIQPYAGSGRVAYAYTNACKFGEGEACATRLVKPMTIRYRYSNESGRRRALRQHEHLQATVQAR